MCEIEYVEGKRVRSKEGSMLTVKPSMGFWLAVADRNPLELRASLVTLSRVQAAGP